MKGNNAEPEFFDHKKNQTYFIKEHINNKEDIS